MWEGKRGGGGSDMPRLKKMKLWFSTMEYWGFMGYISRLYRDYIEVIGRSHMYMLLHLCRRF